MEVWKYIKGYENLYLISNLGNIKSLPKKTRKGIRLLKPVKTQHYFTIDLVKEKKVKKYLLHRLVAQTFLENKENKPQVNHIDGDKSNNSIKNLEWNTRSENQLHSISTGLRTTVGAKNSQCKLSDNLVKQIFYDKRIYKLISKDFGISIPTVCDIKRGYSWTHITGMKNLKKQILKIV